MSGHFSLIRLIFFFMFMNAVSHGLELEIVKQNWLTAKCRSQEGKEVFRWLGCTNMPHGLNKLQCIKAFKTNSKERGEFFYKSCSAPRFFWAIRKYQNSGWSQLVQRRLWCLQHVGHQGPHHKFHHTSKEVFTATNSTANWTFCFCQNQAWDAQRFANFFPARLEAKNDFLAPCKLGIFETPTYSLIYCIGC